MALPLPPESFVDVLIIGAGPAGLMCANALSHAGITVRILDKRCVLKFLPQLRNDRLMFHWSRAVPVTVGPADGIHSRTIEILQVWYDFCCVYPF